MHFIYKWNIPVHGQVIPFPAITYRIGFRYLLLDTFQNIFSQFVEDMAISDIEIYEQSDKLRVMTFGAQISIAIPTNQSSMGVRCL